MPATQAQIGAGTTLGYGASSGGSFTSYGELIDVNQPSGEIKKVEATNYTSPNFVKEFINGKWKEYANLPFKLNYLASQTTTMINSHWGLQQWFKITMPDGSNWIFPGFIAKFGGPLPLEDRITQELEIAITGAPTYNGGS